MTQNLGNGAPGTGEDGSKTPPPPPPATITDATKFEVKDGKMYADGKELSLTSDLIAAKESLKTQLTEAQTVHNDAIDKAKTDLSDAQQQVASANAKIIQMETAQKEGATSAEEVTRVNTERDAAKSRADLAEGKVLELRKQVLISIYKIPADKLADKTIEQLDSLDEALKALGATGGGAGAYALGGGGGAGAKPLTDFERALALIEATPAVGVRNEPPNQ